MILIYKNGLDESGACLPQTLLQHKPWALLDFGPGLAAHQAGSAHHQRPRLPSWASVYVPSGKSIRIHAYALIKVNLDGDCVHISKLTYLTSPNSKGV
jgi:hypothetical protein